MSNDHEDAPESTADQDLQQPSRRPTPTGEKGSALSRLGKKPSFISVNTVLSNLVSKLELDRRLKEHAFMGLWPTVVSETVAQRSRPLFIDVEGNLVVAVKDAAVGQELSFLKVEILQRLRSLARGLGVDVKGLRLDLKHFHQKDMDAIEAVSRKAGQAPVPPNKAQLESIALPSDQLNEIAKLRTSLEENACADSELCERIVSMYEQELRLKQWRQSSGFPKCPCCGEAVPSLHGADALCRDCYFAKMSTRGDI
jgi:hypothetical protein